MEPASPSTPVPPPVSRLPLVAMGAIVGLAVLIAVGLGLRGNETFPPGSPEEALQRFLDAGLEGDEDATVALLDPELRARRRDEIQPGVQSVRGIGFELDEVEVTGTTATVTVTTLFRNVGDPFDGTSRGTEHRFVLRQQGGEWLITEATWPWWIQRCATGR